MGIISKKGGQAIFNSLTTGTLIAADEQIDTSEITDGAVTKVKTAMVSGTKALDGTAEGTFSHTLGATPTFISVVGVGEGSCQPFVVAIGSASGTLTCTGTGTAYWSVY
jgi:hypothetical protein